MAAEKEDSSYVELFDVARKEKVAHATLAAIKFLPRTGERIFIPVKGSKRWDAYTVVAVEYFLGEDSAGEASLSFAKITLYVEESK